MRVLIALGGNAMTSPEGSATPEAQRTAIAAAMERVADLVRAGHRVMLTHGNGPQVGNLLVKNELAARVVPPVPLDWCGAQTQGTVGFLILGTLESALNRRGLPPRVAALVTRTLVDGNDPGFHAPTKPIGRFLPESEAAPLMALGQRWQDRGDKGWRRVVASPEPLEIVDAPAVRALMEAGFVTVSAGGGGIPVTRNADGSLDGVEAVIDKDLAAAVLGRAVAAEVLVIATDVPCAVIGWGTPGARDLGTVSVTELRELAAAGHFASGSMGPKVEAAIRFVERGGLRSVITDLDSISEAVAGRAGTVVVPDS